MCGIFAYIGNKHKYSKLLEYFIKTCHRGPDNCKLVNINKRIKFGFHRLMINGLDFESDQPLHIKKCYLICNGEIYNYKKLIEEFNLDLEYKTNSDCEIIIHLYKRLGFKEMLHKLDGVFTIILYDTDLDELFVARDPLGIRPLFICTDIEGNNDDIGFCSEAKSLLFMDNKSLKQFPPGHSWRSSNKDIYNNYFSYDFNIIQCNDEELVCKNINKLLTSAVNKRLMGDRKVGCLLSGGLDSTLVTALVAKNYKKGELRTYSIGLKGSVDLYWARIAADYLGTDHHEICVTEKDFLDAIPKTIKQIESFCTTTIRASVGNYLVSLYIKENTPDTVIYCGDVSDEIFGSYRGFMNAPDDESFLEANIKMLKDICYFDVLRSDRSISGAGLEARVPFGDKYLVNYVMSLPPKYKTFGKDKIEKYYLRKAFEGYLPHDLLYRKKEAFSDGVSSLERNWFDIIKEYVDKIIPDNIDFAKGFNGPQPYDKESYWYRTIYDEHFKNIVLIPYYWKHPFCNQLDPSARLLKCY